VLLYEALVNFCAVIATYGDIDSPNQKSLSLQEILYGMKIVAKINL
jgi:hypothetical protein